MNVFPEDIMPNAYSVDLRVRILHDCHNGMKRKDVAKNIPSASPASIIFANSTATPTTSLPKHTNEDENSNSPPTNKKCVHSLPTIPVPLLLNFVKSYLHTFLFVPQPCASSFIII